MKFVAKIDAGHLKLTAEHEQSTVERNRNRHVLIHFVGDSDSNQFVNEGKTEQKKK